MDPHWHKQAHVQIKQSLTLAECEKESLVYKIYLLCEANFYLKYLVIFEGFEHIKK